MKIDGIVKKLESFRYPLLVLMIGLLILLLPGGKKTETEDGPEASLCAALSDTRGVGRAEGLISEHGVVVICEGADDAAVKLDILRAVGSYTGFGSDKITILRMGE